MMERDAEISLLTLEIEVLEKELIDAERQRSRDMLTKEYEYDMVFLDYLREDLDAHRARLRLLLTEEYDERGLSALNKGDNNEGRA